MSSFVAGSSLTLDVSNTSSAITDFYNASTSYPSASPTTSTASDNNDYVLIIIIVLVLIVALLIYLSALTGCTKAVFKDDGVPRPRSMLFGRNISRAISRQMSSQQPKRVGQPLVFTINGVTEMYSRMEDGTIQPYVTADDTTIGKIFDKITAKSFKYPPPPVYEAALEACTTVPKHSAFGARYVTQMSASGLRPTGNDDILATLAEVDETVENISP